MKLSNPPARSLDWTAGALAAGLACYRRAEFFEAHDHWEAVWLTLRDPEKSFLQAVIQITAALHHLQQGRPAGTRSLLAKSLQRLEAAPEQFGGLAVRPLRRDMRALLLRLEREDSPQGSAAAAHAPRVHPLS